MSANVIGTLVRQARRDKGLSQAGLAEAAGLSRQSVLAVEAGRGSVESFSRIASSIEFKLSGVSRGATLAEQLRNRRLRSGWSIEKLSKTCGLAPATIRNLEDGCGHLESAQIVLQCLAPHARRRSDPRAHWSPGAPDTRLTPPWVIHAVRESFGPISLDPCAHGSAFVAAAREIYEDECGLKSTWEGSELVFCNPPFSALVSWIDRCHLAWASGEAKTVFGLFPARSDSETYHTKVFGVADILQLRGRIRFLHADGQKGYQAPFPIMFVIWGAEHSCLAKFRELVRCSHIPPKGVISAL